MTGVDRHEYEKRIEENSRKQLELNAGLNPNFGRRVYADEAESLINDAYGFKNSFERYMSVDSQGKPIPWMTYSAVFYLSQLDLSTYDIFEWGSGNSTLYFSERVQTVTSVESNEEWFKYVERNKPKNVELRLVQQNDYAKIISEKGNKYKIISIDGDIYRRFECALYAMEHLDEGGMIILDNSDWLPNTTGLFREKGFTQIDFAGLGPINNYTWCTSIFFKADFDVKNLNIKQPNFLAGGLRNERD